MKSGFIAAILLLTLAPAIAIPADAAARASAVPEARIDTQLPRLPLIERQDIQFSQLSTEAGLSQTRVDQIIQDDEGFLWFATQYGLNRYDGYNFKVFAPDPARPDSLGCAYVYSLLKDHDGAVWVGCEHGVDRFDRTTETFTHYPIETGRPDDPSVMVFDISQDHTGALWLSTSKGLYRLDPATRRATPYRHIPNDPSSLSSDDIEFAGEDSTHRFWVAAGGKLEEFDRGTGKVLLRVPVTDDRLGIGVASLRFYEDQFGIFWIMYSATGKGSGLAVLDRSTNTLTRYSIYDNDSHSELAGGLLAAVEDKDSQLWFASSEGLLRYDRANHVFARYRHHTDDPQSLPEDRIISLCADREGNVWAGLHALAPAFFRSGRPTFAPLLRRPSSPYSLGESFVNAIYQDRQGTLWIGATGALVRIDRGSGQYNTFPAPGRDHQNDIIAITEDPSGNIWLGTFGGGLARFDRASGRYTIYQHKDSDPTSLSDDEVSRILVDSRGQMWITTWNGLNRFDPATGRFTNFKPDARSMYFNIIEDYDGAFLIGGILGLTRFDPVTGGVTLYSHKADDPRSLSDNLVNSVHIDHTGTIWIGTQNGLNQMDRKTGTFTHYYAADGLPVSNISCILEDPLGNLWISSARGLSRFDPLHKRFENFSNADGLTISDLTGWDACFRNEAGEMFFGGFSGGVRFYPEQIGQTTYVPPIVLTGFELSGQPVTIGPQSVLRSSITYTKDLALSHTQSMFSITFATLTFLNPSSARYRFKLEGLDGTWTEVGSDRRVASYTTLPAGRYTFRVQGAISRGVWTEPGVQLGITVLPPWWATWWFRTLAVLVTLFALYLVYFLRVRQIARQYDLRLIARLNERSRIARELHDTLLQSFQGLLLRFQTVGDLLPKRPEQAREVVLSAVEQTAEALTQGRLAVQGLRAPPVEDTTVLGDQLRTLGRSAATETGGDSVSFGVHVAGTPIPLQSIARDEIYRIAGEALRNAFRHSQASVIEVVLRYEPRRLRLVVKDNGTGIVSNVPANAEKGARFGVSGMRERAHVIGGTIEIWTGPNIGTELELTVPASKAYLTARRPWYERFTGPPATQEGRDDP